MQVDFSLPNTGAPECHGLTWLLARMGKPCSGRNRLARENALTGRIRSQRLFHYGRQHGADDHVPHDAVNRVNPHQ